MDVAQTEEQRIDMLINAPASSVMEKEKNTPKRVKRTSFAIPPVDFDSICGGDKRKQREKERKRKRRKKQPAGVPKMFLDRKLGDEGEEQFVWNLEKSRPKLIKQDIIIE